MDNKSLPVLMDEPPTLVYPSLAKALGINHAILFQQLHFLLSITRKAKNKHNFVEGRWWVYNTAAQWQDEYFPWLHANTIARLFRDLEEKGLVLSRQSVRNSSDRTKWYTIDYQAWHVFSQTIATNCDDEPSEQFNQMVATNCDDGYSETTTDKETTLAPRAKRGRKKQVDQAQPPLIAPDSPPDDLATSTQHDPGQSANIAPAAEAPAPRKRPGRPPAESTRLSHAYRDSVTGKGLNTKYAGKDTNKVIDGLIEMGVTEEEIKKAVEQATRGWPLGHYFSLERLPDAVLAYRSQCTPPSQDGSFVPGSGFLRRTSSMRGHHAG